MSAPSAEALAQLIAARGGNAPALTGATIEADHESVDILLDLIFERMSMVDHQVTLIKTFCNINDIAGVARQLKFLSAHVGVAVRASQRIADAKNGGAA
jgi:hypothetical protein